MNSKIKIRQIHDFSRRLFCRQSAETKSNMSSFSNVQQTTTIKLPKQHEWNRAVSRAEKLVGFPTSAFHEFMRDDAMNMQDHMKKLMGSGHPVLKSLKRLIVHGGQNNVQVRGLMMLLLAKSMNTQSDFAKNHDEFDETTGVLINQRKLAEIIEMVSASYSIHKSVMNLPFELPNESSEDTKDDLQKLEFGNKIAILLGDKLLADACVGLAGLRNTYLVELISAAIGGFTQSEFIGNRDVQGQLIPDSSTITLQSWLQRNDMANGKLLSSGFKGIAMLSQFSDDITLRTEQMGRHIALALQAFIELQSFIDETSEQELNLSNAPILFHLQHDPEMLAYIQNCENDISNLNLSQIYTAVRKSGIGIQKTQELCRDHASETFHLLSDLPDGDAKSALEKIVNHLS